MDSGGGDCGLPVTPAVLEKTKMKMNDNQKVVLVVLAIVLVLVAQFIGTSIIVDNAVQPVAQGQFSIASNINAGIKCGPGDTPCVVSTWGRDINVYSDGGSTSKFSVDGATGNIVSAGTLSLGGTPVFWPTPVATLVNPILGNAVNGYSLNVQPTVNATGTPAVVINNKSLSDNLMISAVGTPVVVVNNAGNVSAAGFSVGGTPIAWATPQTKFLNNETTGQYIKCVDEAAVTGTITATPVAGATPVGQPWVSLGTAPTGDAATAYGSYSAGTFTIGVMNTALTPAPNTTPAAVKWCYFYTK